MYTFDTYLSAIHYGTTFYLGAFTNAGFSEKEHLLTYCNTKKTNKANVEGSQALANRYWYKLSTLFELSTKTRVLLINMIDSFKRSASQLNDDQLFCAAIADISLELEHEILNTNLDLKQEKADLG